MFCTSNMLVCWGLGGIRIAQGVQLICHWKFDRPALGQESFTYLDVYISIAVDKVVEVVVLDYIFWYFGEFDFHIFVFIHGCSVVKILDVK